MLARCPHTNLEELALSLFAIFEKKTPLTARGMVTCHSIIRGLWTVLVECELTRSIHLAHYCLNVWKRYKNNGLAPTYVR